MDPKKLDSETTEMIVKRVSVPVGLEELMEGLAKEVLLQKPEDLYLFAAKYFSQLLLRREKSSYKVKAVRSAQSVIEPSRKWSSRNYPPRATAKELSRQMSIRGESPRKDSISKIPQKDRLSTKREGINKIAERKPEPFALEGKKYISNRNSTRNSRNVTIERPKNIHHRDRSHNSAEKNNVVPPVSKPRKSLTRDNKIKHQDKIDDENGKNARSSEPLNENVSKSMHKSAKAERVQTTDKADTELTKQPMAENLLQLAAVDQIQNIGEIKPNDILTGRPKRQTESETAKDIISTDKEVIENLVKEIIPEQQAVHAIEPNNHENVQTSEKESITTPTKDMETDHIANENDVVEQPQHTEKIAEQLADDLKTIVHDEDHKKDNEVHAQNTELDKPISNVSTDVNPFEFVTDILKIEEDVKGEDHKVAHEVQPQNTETDGDISVASKDINPLELVADILKLDSEIKEEKNLKTEPEEQSQNTETDEHIPKASTDGRPLELVADVLKIAEEIKEEKDHMVQQEHAETDKHISNTPNDRNSSELITEEETKNEDEHSKSDDKTQTDNRETPVITSEKENSGQQISSVSDNEVAADHHKELENKKEILPLTTAEGENETKLEVNKSQTLDQKPAAVTSLDETENNKSEENENTSSFHPHEKENENKELNEVNDVEETSVGKIDDQENSSNISDKIPSDHSDVTTENDEIKKEKDIGTIQNEEMKDEQRNSSAEKTDITQSLDKKEVSNIEEFESNGLIKELNNNAITTNRHDKIDKETVEELQSENNKIQGSTLDSNVSAENQSPTSEKTIKNEETEVNNKETMQEGEEPKREEKENLTDEINTHHRVARSLDKITEEISDSKKSDEDIQTKTEEFKPVNGTGEKLAKMDKEKSDSITNKDHSDERNAKILDTSIDINDEEAKNLDKNTEFDIEQKVLEEKASLLDKSLEKKEVLPSEKEGNESGDDKNQDITEVQSDASKNETNKVDKAELHNDGQDEITSKTEILPSNADKNELHIENEKNTEIVDNDKTAASTEKVHLLDQNSENSDIGTEHKNTDSNVQIQSENEKDDNIDSSDSNKETKEKEAEVHNELKDSGVEINLDDIKNELTHEKIAALDEHQRIEKGHIDKLHSEIKENLNERENIDNKSEVENDKNEQKIIDEVTVIPDNGSIEKEKETVLQDEIDKNEVKDQSLNDEKELNGDKKQDEIDKNEVKDQNLDNEKELNGDKKQVISENIEKEKAAILQTEKETDKNENNTLKNESEFDINTIQKEAIDEKVTSPDKSESIDKEKSETPSVVKESSEDANKDLNATEYENDNKIIDEKVGAVAKNETIKEEEPNKSEKEKNENNKLEIQKEFDTVSEEKKENIEKQKEDALHNEKETNKGDIKSLDNTIEPGSEKTEVTLDKNESIEEEKSITLSERSSNEGENINLDKTTEFENDVNENKVINEKVAVLGTEESIEKEKATALLNENEKKVMDSATEPDTDNEKGALGEPTESLETNENILKDKADTLQNEKKTQDENKNLDHKQGSENHQNRTEEEILASLEKDIETSGTEQDEDKSKNVDNTASENNKPEKEVIGEKITSLDKSESTDKKEENLIGDEKEQTETEMNENKNNDAIENEEILHTENVPSEDNTAKILIDNNKEDIDNAENFISKDESAGNKDKVQKAENAKISNDKDKEKVSEEQVPLLEKSSSIEKKEVEVLYSKNDKEDTASKNVDNIEEIHTNNKEDIINKEDGSIDSNEIIEKPLDLGTHSEQERNEVEKMRENLHENEISSKNHIITDENQNTTKAVSLPETEENSLETEAEKSVKESVNETDEDREIAKKILGEAHEISDKMIKSTAEDIEAKKQTQINTDNEKDKNSLNDKGRKIQEDIDDKEAIDATIAEIKAGVISKVVKDYINNFIDNEKVTSSKPNQEASETENINKLEKNVKRTLSLEENKNQINSAKTDSSTQGKPVESNTELKNIYNIPLNHDCDKERYKDRLLNKTSAVLKIQSLWRGFIVRKNLNIFNTYFDNEHETEHDDMKGNHQIVNRYSQDVEQKDESPHAKEKAELNHKTSAPQNLETDIKDETKPKNDHNEEVPETNKGKERDTEYKMSPEKLEAESETKENFDDDTRKPVDLSEEDKSDGEQQDRPKTTDSVVTVICKKDRENSQINKTDELTDLLMDSETGSEGEHLIVEQQSHLLDQISGKNDSDLHHKDYTRSVSSQEEDETGREFCKVQPHTKIMKTLSLPEDVELISDNVDPKKERVSSTEKRAVSAKQEHLPFSKLLHTGELHDAMIVPLSSEIHGVVKSQDENNIIQKGSVSQKPSSPDYSSKGLLHTSELHDSVIVPSEVWNMDGYEENKVTGSKSLEPGTAKATETAEITTSSAQSLPTSTVNVDSFDKARASSRSDSAPSGPGRRSSESRGMEKQNAEVHEFTNKNMEAAAATKIQAGFRGYQVRKELKLKGDSHDTVSQRPASKTKSTSRNSGNRKDIEEKSAVKIQAGVRGFLVRRRQKKQKSPDTK